MVGGCRREAETPAASGSAAAPDAVPQAADYVAKPPVVAGEAQAGPQRIISTAPQLTEIACALGLRDRLVGRSAFCDHPPGIEAVPSIGSLLDVNLEEIVRLEPDLVLISGQSALIRERLKGAGIRYESLPDSSLGDVFEAIRKLGALVGRPRTAARVIESLREDLRRLAAEYHPARRWRVLILTGKLENPPRSPWVAGPGSYLSELLEMAGHLNAAASLKRPYGQISLEEILAVDPDVILEFVGREDAGPTELRRAREVWSQVGPLRALKENRLRLIPGQVHLLPGPRVNQTLRELIRNLAE
jgi:iron complex transport system substrate-binding protein